MHNMNETIVAVTSSVNEIRSINQNVQDFHEKIEEITNIIDMVKKIASQSGLLALNASIEAARAGESGKGFAVVAEEIRVLADNSKETANRIQEISVDVTEAVKNLSVAAEKLLTFVGTTVSKDYDEFVAAAQEYLEDANKMEGMMNTFNQEAVIFVESTKGMSSKLSVVSDEVESENRHIETLGDAIKVIEKYMD